MKYLLIIISALLVGCYPEPYIHKYRLLSCEDKEPIKTYKAWVYDSGAIYYKIRKGDKIKITTRSCDIEITDEVYPLDVKTSGLNRSTRK